MANLDVTVDGNLTSMSAPATTDRLLIVNDDNDSLQDVTLAVLAAFTETLTNKRITKRVATATDDATAVIDSDSYDEYYLTAVANATEFTVTGTPTTGQEIFIGIKDAGVAKALTWTGITALGVTLPTTTVVSKQHIVKIKYISSAWFAIAVAVAA